MDQSLGFIIMIIIWLCIGLPLSKISQAKRRAAAQQRQPAARPDVPQPAPKPAPKTVSVSAAMREGPVRESRMVPTVSVTANDDSVYQGSLYAVTGEGFDPCHEKDLKGLDRAASAAPAYPAGDAHALPFGWTGSDIVRGIVVSEILNRKKPYRAS